MREGASLPAPDPLTWHALQVAAPNGEVIITNDGATILQKMTVTQPAAKMLVELSKSQVRAGALERGSTQGLPYRPKPSGMRMGKGLEAAPKLGCGGHG